MTERICSVDHCEKSYASRGWCEMHYTRWRRHGDPTAGRTPRGEPRRWLAEYLAAEPTDECVEWPYADWDGYGHLSLGGSHRLVTHVVLERTGRPRPPAPNDHALHSCHNPPCINPTHLRWGTNAANVAEKVEAGRCVRGEDHASSVLNASDVHAIRERRATGDLTYRELADEYGVAEKTIRKVVHRETWAHVTPDVGHGASGTDLGDADG